MTDANANPATPGGREELQKFANGWLVEVSFGVYDREDLPRLADKLIAEIDPLLSAARLSGARELAEKTKLKSPLDVGVIYATQYNALIDAALREMGAE